ncbi:MAG: hypothetical protein KDB80_06105, partial [Planctomycetes bacterium]|nr:hypothetical protein [Planctomycetota bacterium]
MTIDREARLAFELAHLQLNKRARDACQHLGLTTVAEALGCTESEFTTAPNCGRKTFESLRQRLHGFVEHAPDIDLSTLALDRELADVSRSPVVAVLAKAGFTTVGHFATTPPEELCTIRGVDADALRRLSQEVLAPIPNGSALLPDELLELRLDELILPDTAVRVVRERGLTTVGDLLSAERDEPDFLDPIGLAAVRREIARTVRRGTDPIVPTLGRESLFEPLLACLLDRIEDAAGLLLTLRIGLDQPAKQPWQIAAEQRRAEAEVLAAETAMRRLLAEECSAVLDRFARTIRSELAATDAILTPDRATPGGLLDPGRAGRAHRDAPLRLAALLFPDEFYFHDGFLSDCPPERHSRVVRALRELCDRDLLPRRLDEVRSELSDRSLETSHEVVVYVLRKSLQRSIEIDADRGEWVHVRVTTVADRLFTLLDEHDEPVPLDTLMFDYRGRHRR